jgi:hypothetical protein
VQLCEFIVIFTAKIEMTSRTFQWNADDFFEISNETQTLIAKQDLKVLTTFPVIGSYYQRKAFAGLKQLSAYTLIPNVVYNVDVADQHSYFRGFCNVVRVKNTDQEANAIFEPYYVPEKVHNALVSKFGSNMFPRRLVCVLTIIKNINERDEIKVIRNDLFGQWADNILPKELPEELQLPVFAAPKPESNDSGKASVILPNDYDAWFELQYNVKTDEVNVIAAQDITAPLIVPCIGRYKQQSSQRVNPYTNVSGSTNTVAYKLWPARSNFKTEKPVETPKNAQDEPMDEARGADDSGVIPPAPAPASGLPEQGDTDMTGPVSIPSLQPQGDTDMQLPGPVSIPSLQAQGVDAGQPSEPVLNPSSQSQSVDAVVPPRKRFDFSGINQTVKDDLY